MLEMDDVAVVLAHWAEDARPASIELLREQVLGFASGHGMATASCRDVGLAVTEAVANAVQHAYPDTPGSVTIDAATDGDLLSLRVSDDGAGVGSASQGLGVQLMRGMAERVEIGPNRGGVGTVVTMEFPMGARRLVAGG